MWASTVDSERLQRANSRPGQNQWHRDGPHPDADRIHELTHPTEEVEDSDLDDRYTSGTWGERDVGRFDQQEAAEQLEALRRNLTELSRTRSKDTENSLRRTISGRSGLSRRGTHPALERPRTARSASIAEMTLDTDLEAGAEQEDEESDLELDQFLREGHFEKRSEAGSAKKVGVIYKVRVLLGINQDERGANHPRPEPHCEG